MFAKSKGGRMEHESLLGEWIGVSLGRLAELKGHRASVAHPGTVRLAVFASEVEPRDHAVTIVKWREVFERSADPISEA